LVGGRSLTPYPHLPPALQALTGDALRFWGEPSVRARMLRAILTAADTAARTRALRAVDDAVTSGMAALGFPRAPVRSLSLVLPHDAGDLGVKYFTCELQIGLPGLRRALGPGGAPDEVVETWIHESAHGRQFPWSPSARAELQFRGFEEGLAEGIAGLVSHWAAFVPGVPVYGRYVQTYEILADLLGINPEMIYRRLYRHTNGAVMGACVAEIDALHTATGASPFTVEQRGRLERTARRLFDIAYQQEPASPRAHRTIRQAWRRALS
jgi:hypothetical protein